MNITAGSIASLAQSQYYKRPADQRYETLDALAASVHNRRNRSLQSDVTVNGLTFESNGSLYVRANGNTLVTPTHYAFGQTARLLGAPSKFLRELGEHGDHALVAQNLTKALALRGQKLTGKAGDMRLLLTDDVDGDATDMVALTSRTYGRIWDADVVAMVQRIVDARPEFHNPLEWGGKRGGLYASQQDLTIAETNFQQQETVLKNAISRNGIDCAMQHDRL